MSSVVKPRLAKPTIRQRLSASLAGAALSASIWSATSLPARAAAETASFQVQITIQAACAITGITNLNFGSVATVTATDAASSFNVQCTAATPYTIGLSQGANGASVTARQMSGPGGTIGYALYRDAARTQNWGLTAGTDTVSATGNGAAQAFSVYGRVPAQATPAPGAYVDTVTITVTY